MLRLALKLYCETNFKFCVKQLIRQCHTAERIVVENMFAAQYCMNIVEKNDHEVYLCTLLLSNEQRRHAFAIRAFNAEVADSDLNVTNEHAAKLKFKFWSDSVEKCFEPGYVADHPVLLELKNTLATEKVNKIFLKRLVTARERPLNQQFVTIVHLENYADQVFSSILHMMVAISGVKDLQVDNAVSHLGKAQGVTAMLRAAPYQGRNRALNVPQEVLVKHGVSQERILRDNVKDQAVEDCIFELASVAHAHLEKARSLIDHIPNNIRNLMLPAVAVSRYLERLRKAKFRLTHQSCLQCDTMLPMALYWHNLRNLY